MLRPLPLLALCLALTACDKSQSPSDAPSKKTADAKPTNEATDAKAATPKQEGDAKADGHAKAEPPAGSAQLGQPAPAFTLTDLDGKSHSLADYRGKLVVLEWFNPQCPFVNFAHEKGPLNVMAAKQTGEGVVWLAINSGGEGRQGHGDKANRDGVSKFSLGHPILLDEDGAIGHMYGAIKTPHMFLIDDKGTLVYRGAIDNAPFGEVDGDGEHQNYLAAALADVRAGNAVATADTPAYGCTVKYAK
ncbi:MAG: redoxin domain-containing protein [Deltaproteobacteria bacterium]|nr:redoxin domain-containing protein [Deltaproteobacteria bacterium]